MGGIHTRLRVRGCESPNSDDWKKSLVLYLLCVMGGFMSVYVAHVPWPHASMAWGEGWCASNIAFLVATHTDKKEKKISLYIRKFNSYMVKIFLIYGKNICVFPHILGSHDFATDPSEFPYLWGKFCFLFYQCRLGKFLERGVEIYMTKSVLVHCTMYIEASCRRRN